MTVPARDDLREFRYRITRIAIGRHAHLDIDESDYAALRSARNALNEESYFLEKFYAVVESYKAVERFIHQATLDILLERYVDTAALTGIGAEFGRVTALLLSSVRLYLDTLASHVEGMTYDENAAGMTNVFRSEKYDSSFEYRFMEAVRNFSQHKGFPVHRSSYGSRHDPETRVWDFSADFYFLSAEVVDPKFKKPVLNEVNAMGGKVDLKSALRAYFADICDIHQQADGIATAALALHEHVVERWRQQWIALTGDGEMLGVAAGYFDGRLLIDRSVAPIYFGPQLDEYRIHLRQHTQNLTNMHARRISL